MLINPRIMFSNKRFLFTSALVALVICFHSCGNRKDTSEVRKIEVIGSAQMDVVPDEISMIFTIREYLSAPGVKVQLEDVKKEFLTLCRNSGIPDSNISITGFTGNERWDYYWHRRGKRDPQFLSSVSYLIKLNNLEKADTMVASLNSKAVESFYISHTTHTKLEQMRHEVKKKALQAAMDKASQLAGSIDQRIGKAVFIQEIDDTQHSDRRMSMDMTANHGMVAQEAAPAAAPATPLYQKIRLRYEVKAQFELE